MDEDLESRFLRQKLEDLLNDNTNLIPTIICERERPEIEELIRKYCLYSENMIPYRIGNNPLMVKEGLDRQRKSIDWGNLYINIHVN